MQNRGARYIDLTSILSILFNLKVLNLPESVFWAFVAPVVEDEASPENTYAIITYILQSIWSTMCTYLKLK